MTTMKLRGLALKPVLLGCALILLWVPSQALRGQDSSGDIKKVLADQVMAWNRADVDGFMAGYKDSPETTFVGKNVLHGWQQMMARYKQLYPTKDAMGTLDFSELNVRMLGADYAVVTGKFHLTRTAAGGGDASGIFSLVFEKSADGWKIILDHTS
jgi:uncharacterized protein (TIGR02246 family)